MTLRPLVSGMAEPSSNVFFFVGALFLFFVWFLKSVLRGEIFFRKTPLDFLHLIFLCALGLSWSQSIHRYEGIPFILNMLTVILVYCLIIQTHENEADSARLILFLLMTASIVSFYALYQRLFGLHETFQYLVEHHVQIEKLTTAFKHRLTSPRVFATLIYPNALAGYLLSIIPLALSTILIKKGGFYRKVAIVSIMGGVLVFLLCEKPLWMIAGGVLGIFYPFLYLLAFFLTLSKGGWAVFFLMRVMAYFLFYREISPRFKKLFLLGVGLLEMGGCFFLMRHDPDFLFKAFKSFEVRCQYWQAAGGMVRDYLGLGVGPAAFGSLYAHYQLPSAEETRMAHNNFLQVASELGIIGGVAFLLIWLVPLIKGLKKFQFSSPIERGALFASLAFVLHGLVDFDLYEPALAMNAWAFLALLSCGHSEKRHGFSFRCESSKMKGALMIAGQVVAVSLILLVRSYDQAENYFRQAVEARAQKKWEEAGWAVERSLQFCHLNPQAYVLKATLNEREKKWHEAIASYEEAIQRDSHNPLFPYRQSLLYERLEKEEGKSYASQIEACLKKAIFDYPSHASLHLALAHFYQRVGRREEALVEYKEATRLGRNP